MDLKYFFFNLAPALQFIFEMDYIPQEDDFQELSPELYDAFKLKASEKDLKAMYNKKIMAFIPEDQRLRDRILEVHGKNFLIVSEEERGVFADAAAYIDHMCEIGGKEFDNLHDKLAYMARILPPVFTKGTSYAVYSRPKKK